MVPPRVPRVRPEAPLKVGHRQRADEVPGAEGGDPVFEVLPHPGEGGVFERSVAMHGQVAVAEFDQRQGSLLSLLNFFSRGRLAVVLDESDDVASGRDFQQVLLQAEKKVIDLGGNRLGLGCLDLAEIVPVPFSLVAENAIPDAVSFLKGSHVAAPDEQRHCHAS
jgi:hypothetical protein